MCCQTDIGVSPGIWSLLAVYLWKHLTLIYAMDVTRMQRHDELEILIGQLLIFLKLI
jgi:23S rRNA U2552 (ribose-2'-O)-methylase RlmE/FtsJ